MIFWMYIGHNHNDGQSYSVGMAHMIDYISYTYKSEVSVDVSISCTAYNDPYNYRVK